MAEAIKRRATEETTDGMLYEYDHNAIRIPEQQPSPAPVRSPQRLPKAVPQSVPREVPHRRISLLYIVVLVIGVVLFGKIISMRAEMTQLAVKSQTLNSAISSMQKDQSALRLALNNQMTQKEIEEYAENVLGMVKAGDEDISYLRYHNDAVYEIAEDNQSTGVADLLWKRLKSGVESIWNFIN